MDEVEITAARIVIDDARREFRDSTAMLRRHVPEGTARTLEAMSLLFDQLGSLCDSLLEQYNELLIFSRTPFDS